MSILSRSARALRASRPFAAAGMGALAVAGCTVGPNYVKPDVSTPAAFADAAPAGAPGATLSRVTTGPDGGGDMVECVQGP